MEADKPTASGETDSWMSETAKFTARLEDPNTGETRTGYSYEIEYKNGQPIDPVVGRQ